MDRMQLVDDARKRTGACRPEAMKSCGDAGGGSMPTRPITTTRYADAARSSLPAFERRESRVPCRVPVTISAKGSTALAGSTDVSHRGIYVSCLVANAGEHVVDSVNVSPHGLYVSCDVVVAKDDEIELSFQLPGSEAPILARGRIAWTNNEPVGSRQGLPRGFGVQITEITGQGLAALRTRELREFISARNVSS